MLLTLIIFCDIMFWVFLISGLCARYLWKKQKLSSILLILSPCVDVVLLIVTAIDIRNGGTANFVHALAAIYIGMSLVYGKRIISWADVRFANKYQGTPMPNSGPKSGKIHASIERKGWLRHLLMFGISLSIMLVLVLISGDLRTLEAFKGILSTWTVILFIDFVISFSYTLFPKKVHEDQ